MGYIEPKFKIGDEVLVPPIGATYSSTNSPNKLVRAVVSYVHPSYGWCLCTYASGLRTGFFFDQIKLADTKQDNPNAVSSSLKDGELGKE